MKQVWRILAAALAIVALAAGGTVAFAQRGGGNDNGKGHAKKAAAERVFTFSPQTKANPEGIVFDKRLRRFFVSDTGDGTIYSGTLGSDTLTPFITGPDKPAIGLEVRRNRLYVAGGPSGEIRVYNLRTKKQVASFETGSGGFLNDLAVTGRGDVFVTDSFRSTLWHVTPAQVRAGTGTVQGLEIPPAEIDFDGGDGIFNLNGIVAKTGHKLVVVNSNTGGLFRIDLRAKRDAIRRIDEIEGVTVKGGDGMILDRGRLVVVQGDPARLHFVKLRRGLRRAADGGTQTSDNLAGPSTVARARKLYLVVNANFGGDQPFTVAGLPRNRRGR